MDKMKRIAVLAVIVMLCGISFVRCSSDEEVGSGSLKVVLTDAPFPFESVAEANVTITKIEARRAREEDESEGSPFIVLSEEEMSFNLLDLTNGITETLAEIEVPVGSYDLIRLYVSDASVVMAGGANYDVRVPSGEQTGIKVFVKPSIIVDGGLTTELLLDFDVSRSFIPQGNANGSSGITGFNFRPTIKAANLSTAGRLIGTVTDSLDLAAESALITVFAQDTVNTSSIADKNGNYAIIGLEAGTYDITVEYEDYRVYDAEGITITAANATTLDVKLEDQD